MPASAAAHLLTRQSHRKRGAKPLSFLGDLSLERARVHEFCGPSRRTLALALAGGLSGPVIWIRPNWTPGGLNPDGMHRLVDPARIVFVAARRPEDCLWTMEEALRAGVVPLVVADLPAPPSLTAVRRQHLAAETGAGAGEGAPLGVILTPEAGGSPGVESRWGFTPRHGDGGAEIWELNRLRARTEPEKRWQVMGTKDGLVLHA